LKQVDETSVDDLLSADAIGWFTNLLRFAYGTVGDPLESLRIHGGLEGKVGAALASAERTATGAETAVLSIT